MARICTSSHQRPDPSLARFGRDPTNGSLTFLEVLRPSSSSPAEALAAPRAARVMPDGLQLAVIGGLTSLSLFSRESVTGALSLDQTITEGLDGFSAAAGVSG